MNTVEKGRVRSIVFKDGDIWYGVALEFNIVEEADDAEVANFNLQEAIRGYVASQRKIKGSRVEPLNQKPIKEYQEMWDNLSAEKPIPTPYEVKYYGYSFV